MDSPTFPPEELLKQKPVPLPRTVWMSPTASEEEQV